MKNCQKHNSSSRVDPRLPASSNPLINALGFGIVGVACFFFIRFVLEHAASLPKIKWTVQNIGRFSSVVALYLMVVIIGGLIWYLLLKGVGENWAFQNVLGIFTITQFAKYIPGNVAHLIGRVGLARTLGMSTTRVILTMVIEIVWVLVAGSTLAITTLITSGGRLFASIPELPSSWLLALMIITTTLIPFISVWALKRWHPRLFKKMVGSGEVSLPKTNILIASLILSFLNLILMGAGLDLLGLCLFSVRESNLWTLIGISSVAWIAGFLTPGAPAGLGVRDAILLTGLNAIYDPGTSIGIVVAWRVATSVGDGMAFLAGLIGYRLILRS